MPNKPLEKRFLEEVQQRKQPKNKAVERHKVRMLLLIVLMVAGFAYVFRQGNLSLITNEPTTKPTPVDLPPSGVLSQHHRQDLNSNMGRLRIFLRAPLPSETSSLPSTCSGDTKSWSPRNGKHYFITLLDWQSNQVVMTAFIRAGDKVELRVPFGSYKLRYTAGDQWYGEAHLFGSNVKYEMTEQFSPAQTAKFEFTREKRGGDMGFYCLNGNLGSKAVKDDTTQR